jgi:hypothetical protein
MNLTDRDKRIVKIGGPVLGGVIVLLLAFSLFAGGGSEEVPSPGPVLPTTPPAPTSESPSPTPSASPVIVFAGRDPFAIPSVLASSTVSPTVSGATPTSTSPGSSPTSPAPTTTPPITPSGGTSKDVGGRTVVILDTFARGGAEKAQVEVDGTVYTVAEGDRFAGRYELVSISGNCGDFLYGEESFTLCTDAQK